MPSMRIGTLVDALVQQEMDRPNWPGDNNQALHFAFDLRMSYIKTPHNFGVSRGLHLLYHRLPNSARISTFSGVMPSPFAKLKEVSEWRFEGCHDSCWRTCPALSRVYFEMADELNGILREKGIPEEAPCNFHEYNSFPVFDRHVFEWVPVEVKIDPADRNNHKRLITLSPDW